MRTLSVTVQPPSPSAHGSGDSSAMRSTSAQREVRQVHVVGVLGAQALALAVGLDRAVVDARELPEHAAVLAETGGQNSSSTSLRLTIV